MKLKMKNVVCAPWIFLSVQYSRMYCPYDFLRYCTYDYIALTRRIVALILSPVTYPPLPGNGSAQSRGWKIGLRETYHSVCS